MRRTLLTVTLGLAAATAVAQSRLSVEQRLERLERRVGTLTELTLQLQALRQENQQLRGQLEVQQHQLQSLERKQRDLYLDVDQRLSAMQAGTAPAAVAPTPSPPAAPSGAPPAATGAAATAPVDAAAQQAAYDAAYDLLRPEQRRYSEAITAFDSFLSKYPDSSLAPNARYWRAEAYYVTNQNDQALAAFREVVERHPGSQKVPDSWLKIGYLLHAQGQPDEAREVLQRVIEDHPDSPVAGMAHQRLDRIARERR